MTELSQRPLVDAFGAPVHGCPAAVTLSWARLFRAEAGGSNPAITWSDAIAKYARVESISGACADCRAEAAEGLAETVRS